MNGQRRTIDDEQIEHLFSNITKAISPCRFEYVVCTENGGGFVYYESKKSMKGIQKMQSIPKLLFKYKKFDGSEKSIRYAKEILQENKLFLSPYKKTNDPLEGAGHNINIQGWSGLSIQYYADEELGPIERIKEKYGILSLSEDAVSPQMWAYYGDDYSGICFCFSTKGDLNNVKKVKYSNYTKEKRPWSDTQLEKDVCCGFFQKSIGWKYEKEWRIIRLLNDEKNYVYIKKDELVGIIIGHKMEERLQGKILELVPDNIKVMKTRIGYQHPAIHLQPIAYEYIHNGSPIDYIDNLEEYLLAGEEK